VYINNSDEETYKLIFLIIYILVYLPCVIFRKKKYNTDIKRETLSRKRHYVMLSPQSQEYNWNRAGFWPATWPTPSKRMPPILRDGIVTRPNWSH